MKLNLIWLDVFDTSTLIKPFHLVYYKPLGEKLPTKLFWVRPAQRDMYSKHEYEYTYRKIG